MRLKHLKFYTTSPEQKTDKIIEEINYEKNNSINNNAQMGTKVCAIFIKPKWVDKKKTKYMLTIYTSE